MPKVTLEKCYVCGCTSEFTIYEDAVLLREAKCSCCGATLRTSDVAKNIVNMLLNRDESLKEAHGVIKEFKIFNAIASGQIHEMLKDLPGYVCGEYIDGIVSGHFHQGILCVDLRNMPFASESFDLIISEDVFEHIDGFTKAFAEINRVLKKGGYHIFTVPLHEGRYTKSREGLNSIYHGVHLVITDFGDDLLQIVDKFGMQTQRLEEHRFYDSKEITNLEDELQYHQYLVRQREFQNHEGYVSLLRFFKYNSIVFGSLKIDNLEQETSCVMTGERFIPDQFGARASSEHIQRYMTIQEIVRNKIVLDAACGEGYGSNLLSETASEVVGIDISTDTINSARNKYRRNNLKYEVASITNLPFEDNSVDVVVSFETIEHVVEDMQQKFLCEVKRVLKPDGILIISTPDKMYHTDIPNQINEFHVKEFYEKEFLEFLKEYFVNVDFYYQGLKSYLSISPKNHDQVFTSTCEVAFPEDPTFIIAVCTQEPKEQCIDISTVTPVLGKGNYVSLLYIDYGDGFLEKNTLSCALHVKGRNFVADFNIPCGTKILGLRWDPLESYFCRIKIVSICSDKKVFKVKNSNAWRQFDEYDEFRTIDPSYYLDGDFKEISRIRIEGILDLYNIEGIYEIFGQKVKELERINLEQGRLVAEKERVLAEIEGSKFWKITKPFRLLKKFCEKNSSK